MGLSVFRFVLYQTTRTSPEINEKNKFIYVDKTKKSVTARFYKVEIFFSKKTHFKRSYKYQHLIDTNRLRLIKR